MKKQTFDNIACSPLCYISFLPFREDRHKKQEYNSRLTLSMFL